MKKEKLLEIYEAYQVEREKLIAAGEKLTKIRSMGYIDIWASQFYNKELLDFKTSRQIAIDFIDSEDRIEINLIKGINQAFTSGAFEDEKFMGEIRRVYLDLQTFGLGKNDPPMTSIEEAYNDIEKMRILKEDIMNKFVNDEDYRRAFLKLWYDAGGTDKDYWFNPSPKDTDE